MVRDICKQNITRRSRGIHAAWHFWYAVSFGGKGGLRKVGLCGIHPLTQRYANIQISRFSSAQV
ncbi:DUF3265 domain-containing protein [Vibrio vulnificus]|nr:DUF3265 domain-containing protein [Vibrio vulnificus]MDK2622588.1 DUF3265 domain-containing protein [Vibrio vulnificus]HDY7708643.1 DUF3265 domain-containing protein [Vibrio vulnificus]